jgi:cation:H+ antiporter
MLVYILFVIGFVALIKGADLLVSGASSVAKRFNISAIVIGLTIVAFGTSAPEFVVNLFAASQGSTDIAIGNILGSNIANILMVLGITAIIYPVAAKNNTVLKEIPFSLLAAVVLGILANDILLNGAADSILTRGDGLLLLTFFIIFLYYSFGIAFGGDGDGGDDIKKYTTRRSVAYILLGLVGLTLGGKWIVDGAEQIATVFGLSETVIAIAVVAVGTSLPELATSVVAALKKQTDIAIGNVVGSNIFNIFWVLGFSAVVRPLPFNPNTNIDVLMTIVASVVLFAVMFTGKRGKGRQYLIDRKEGILMVVLYVSYIAFLIIRG